MSADALLSVRDLRVHFPVTAGIIPREVASVRAVDGISFEVMRGETFGVVGESGSGKTTAVRAILRLNEVTGGSVMFEGATSPRSRSAKCAACAAISRWCSRTLTHRSIHARPLRSWLESRSLCMACAVVQGGSRVDELLELVGLSAQFANRYPHEFSGGQRQRVGIARALAVEPKFLVCDEPVSALDVSVQAQVINLLGSLQKNLASPTCSLRTALPSSGTFQIGSR